MACWLNLMIREATRIGIIEFGAGKRPNNNHDLKFNWIWQNNDNISLIILSEGMMFIPIDPG